jgi:hypothetical protein
MKLALRTWFAALRRNWGFGPCFNPAQFGRAFGGVLMWTLAIVVVGIGIRTGSWTSFWWFLAGWCARSAVLPADASQD